MPDDNGSSHDCQANYQNECAHSFLDHIHPPSFFTDGEGSLVDLFDERIGTAQSRAGRALPGEIGDRTEGAAAVARLGRFGTL
jgi:hypothetical protein